MELNELYRLQIACLNSESSVLLRRIRLSPCKIYIERTTLYIGSNILANRRRERQATLWKSSTISFFVALTEIFSDSKDINRNINPFIDMPTYSDFFRSFLRFGTTHQKWKLAAITSSVGLSAVGLLWHHQHYASSYSVQLKRYSASAEYPQLSKHSNLMARQLTPQVRVNEISL